MPDPHAHREPAIRSVPSGLNLFSDNTSQMEEYRQFPVYEGEHPSTIPSEQLVLCLIQDGNRILLQNRVKEDWKEYTLPGGHVEPGKSFVDAVIREMKEETGLEILNPQLVGIKQFPIEGGRYIVLLFKTESFKGEVISSDEGEMEWIEYGRLSEVDTVNDLAELLKVMNTPELTEFQYIVDGDNWNISLR